jgi:hypothetical protein
LSKSFRALAFKKELLLLFLIGCSAQAVESSTSYFSMPSAERANVFGQVRFETLQYLTTLSDAPELTYSQFLSGKLTATSYVSDPGRVNWAVDLSAGTFFSLKQSYYSLQELYLSTHLDERAQISLGRKKYNWSEIDRVWAFGLWQPRYNIDALRPEDNGLTGLFFDYKAEQFQFLAFASSLFIPTVGPEIREEDGQLKADNRWYRPPSRQSGKISLSYDLEVGDVMELLRQESYALQIRLGREDLGPWAAFSGGRKPINDIAFQRCLRCVSANSEAEFIVGPRVTHHQVFSMDLGYNWESVKTSISYYEDEPESLLPPLDYAVQRYDPIRMYAAQIELSTRNFFDRTIQVQAAYLRSVGGEITDIESEGQASEITLFTDRYRFSNVASFSFLGELTSIYSRPLVSKIEFVREFDQEGSILGLELQYQWNRAWSYIFGFDALTVDDSSSTSDSFINTYRANDRVYAGASYVF